MAKYQFSICIFTRDLRIYDNLTLIKACSESITVIPIFIFTKEQVENNSRFNHNAFQFLFESLQELEKNIPLQFFYGDLHNILKLIISTNNNIQAIYISQDFTPFAINRESQLLKLGLDLHVVSNHTLINNMHQLKTNNNNIYTLFTPFKNKFESEITIIPPNLQIYNNFYQNKFTHSIKLIKMRKYFKINHNIANHGTQKHAKKILKRLVNMQNYNNIRNYPEYSTTNLSPYIKFGLISIRDIWFISKKYKILKFSDSLIWREFYYYILFHNPQLLINDYNPKWKSFEWSFSATLFKKWCSGNTGFPIVDAGMRELNKTGYMHNRVRMIVAMFLTKNLMIDWRKGEKYFSKLLIDSDPAINNGNWQWSASTGVDPLKYGKPRIMNPWLQQKKYDSQCVYIFKWIPELRSVPINDIHVWYKKYNNYNVYLKPIIDFDLSIRSYLHKFNKL